ncbi:hypothetical protein GCM10018772_11240 [Streptomyces fumanus]|uniref:Uncharacterized protein n=1 Tax=Streptomyces fumanus TaxID=67302 RepID=A0A919A6G7_9ACTN|nr:hypothetical protein GCM10018772_11240 [Streptomyces fumanus]
MGGGGRWWSGLFGVVLRDRAAPVVKAVFTAGRFPQDREARGCQNGPVRLRRRRPGLFSATRIPVAMPREHPRPASPHARNLAFRSGNVPASRLPSLGVFMTHGCDQLGLFH